MELEEEKNSTTTKLVTLDDYCALLHPIQSHLRFKYLDFRRVNGRFAIPNSKLLNVFIFLAILDCIGNVIKCVKAVKAKEITKSQEVFAVFGMAFVMTTRGLMLALSRGPISDFYNKIDALFPRSAYLQKRMEVQQIFNYTKKRFFLMHVLMSISLTGFLTFPGVKFFLLYDFQSEDILADAYHVNASWMPFGLKEKLSTYPYTYIYESIMATAALNMIITWDEVFVNLISQLCMYYKYLGKLLEEMDVHDALDPIKMDAFYNKLHQYIDMHQHLNKLAVEFNDLFNFSILFSDASIAISICFNLFLISGATDYVPMMTYGLPLVVETLMIYDAAKWGTQLETVTARINEVLYEQNWYDSSLRYGKYTMMWMQSTSEPIRLTAFNMFYVNMKHFQDMMMLAYQLLTFLKSKG